MQAMVCSHKKIGNFSHQSVLGFGACVCSVQFLSPKVLRGWQRLGMQARVLHHLGRLASVPKLIVFVEECGACGVQAAVASLEVPWDWPQRKTIHHSSSFLG